MSATQFLRLVAKLIRDHATHLPEKGTWVLTVPRLQKILEEHVGSLPSDFRSIEDVVEEGMIRDLWEISYDRKHFMDVVVVRQSR